MSSLQTHKRAKWQDIARYYGKMLLQQTILGCFVQSWLQLYLSQMDSGVAGDVSWCG